MPRRFNGFAASERGAIDLPTQAEEPRLLSDLPLQAVRDVAIAQAGSAAHPGETEGPARGPDLCVVVPTFNESASIEALVEGLRAALRGISWEAIFVDDDSPDGTAATVNRIAREDVRIRAIRRIARRGLSSAVVEGMLATSAPYVAVIDADMQHDETLLPRMLAALMRGECDIVIASRAVSGGEAPGLSRLRRRVSAIGSRIARRAIHSDVRDIMSGYFMLRREVVEAEAGRLSKIGFKILVDILASSERPLRALEIPYRFRARRAGASKLDAQAASAFILLLIDKRVGRWISVRFVAFAAVGSVGIGVHLATLALLYRGLGLGFALAQAAATLVAITSNYSLNNAFTYRDLRLRGLDWLKGWVSFALVSAIGAVGNVGVADVLYNRAFSWQIAGIAGIAVGTFWNFGMTRAYTWHDR
jgi:dolichol-phosphate mannosyltransferase